ncbi:MAG TPA: acyl carrier protein [Azonexus sp.]|nr:acyl carrier protein [Azonexus sp.]
MFLEQGLNTEKEVLSLLDEILSLNGRSAEFTASTPLLGAIPELDSMAVVALITGLEERFGFSVDDDEIEGSTFATLGSLIEFVEGKLAA